MKRLLIPTCFLLIPFFSMNIVNAQCTPDTVHCKDTLLPGEICPLRLPDGYVNEQYSEVFTVIPPSVFYSILDTLEIAKIVIDSVGNLPPGLTYTANSDTFYAGKAYCILLSGRPAKAGSYDLSITVIPYVYIDFLGNRMLFESTPVVNDTSLTITIYEQAGLEVQAGADFSVLPATPNPYQNSTRIGFFTQRQDIVELRIFNMLGQLVYHEANYYPSGKHYFNFRGFNMLPGTYIYRVSSSTKYITKKLIRIEQAF